MELKVNENGQVVQVVTSTLVNEVPISSTEIQRQINEHQAIIDKLSNELENVLLFEEENNVQPPVENVVVEEPVEETEDVIVS